MVSRRTADGQASGVTPSAWGRSGVERPPPVGGRRRGGWADRQAGKTQGADYESELRGGEPKPRARYDLRRFSSIRRRTTTLVSKSSPQRATVPTARQPRSRLTTKSGWRELKRGGAVTLPGARNLLSPTWQANCVLETTNIVVFGTQKRSSSALPALVPPRGAVACGDAEETGARFTQACQPMSGVREPVRVCC